jgi:hypothetical protein
VGVLVGSGVGVLALVGVSVGAGVLVGVAAGSKPQADKTTDRNTSTNKNFFMDLILLKDIIRYHTAFIPGGRVEALGLKRY